MKVWLALILILLLSCSRRVFRYASFDPATVKKEQISSLQIDGSYKFYVRQVEEDTTQNENKLQSKNVVNKDQLIEVEYLFISAQNVVYISTISDVYKKRYRNYYLGDRYVNAFDFQTFLFGKIENNQIHFTGWKKGKSDHWNISYHSDSVYIDDVIEKLDGIFENQAPVEEALSKSVFFSRVNDPLLVFHVNGSSSDTIPLRDNTFYLVKKGSRCWLYLQFEGIAKKRNLISFRAKNQSYTTIRYPEKRIACNPCQVFMCDSLNPR